MIVSLIPLFEAFGAAIFATLIILHALNRDIDEDDEEDNDNER